MARPRRTYDLDEAFEIFSENPAFGFDGRSEVEVNIRKHAPKTTALSARHVFDLARKIPYRCPRCFSSERPPFFDGFYSRVTEIHLLQHLCLECLEASDRRARNELNALAMLASELKKEGHSK